MSKKREPAVEPGRSLFDKLVKGAASMVPLLFANLVGLVLIEVLALIPHLSELSRRQE